MTPVREAFIFRDQCGSGRVVWQMRCSVHEDPSLRPSEGVAVSTWNAWSPSNYGQPNSKWDKRSDKETRVWVASQAGVCSNKTRNECALFEGGVCVVGN